MKNGLLAEVQFPLRNVKIFSSPSSLKWLQDRYAHRYRKNGL
jgi:hypothetical protein